MKRPHMLALAAPLLLFSCATPDDGSVQDAYEVEADAADPQVAALLAKLASCDPASNGKYKTDFEFSASVPICRLNGAFFWKADMDIDCDGKRTSVCNENADPWYQNQTSAQDSHGRPLDASKLPYVVIPLPSNRFNYRNRGIHLGQVVAVIYNGKLRFGVFGDEGPSQIIGEASYAMAKELGINPDPANGGTDAGVTYLVFTGNDAVVDRLEDTAQTAAIGQQRLQRLLQEN
jgi:Fungal chitosanase of glycosyl hydrolase group 75